jgi:hypothetical protein
MSLDPPPPPKAEDLVKAHPATGRFEVGSFDMVRNFVEHGLKATTPSSNSGRSRFAINWSAVEASVADAPTLELAIGRAVVVADQMARGLFDGPPDPDRATADEEGAVASQRSLTVLSTRKDEGPSQVAEDPFFAFSIADVVPDFGDDSRYRLRVARKVARILGIRRAAAAMAVALMLAPVSFAFHQAAHQGPSATSSYGTHGYQVAPGTNADLVFAAAS